MLGGQPRGLQLGDTRGGFGLRFLPPVRLESGRTPGVLGLGRENRGPLLGCFSGLLEVRGLSRDALLGLTKRRFVLLGPEGGVLLDGFLGGAFLRGLPERVLCCLPGGVQLQRLLSGFLLGGLPALYLDTYRLERGGRLFGHSLGFGHGSLPGSLHLCSPSSGFDFRIQPRGFLCTSPCGLPLGCFERGLSCCRVTRVIGRCRSTGCVQLCRDPLCLFLGGATRFGFRFAPIGLLFSQLRRRLDLRGAPRRFLFSRLARGLELGRLLHSRSLRFPAKSFLRPMAIRFLLGNLSRRLGLSCAEL